VALTGKESRGIAEEASNQPKVSASEVADVSEDRGESSGWQYHHRHRLSSGPPSESSPLSTDRDGGQIIGFRNVLVHGYDAIDDQIVWQVIQQPLPVLK